MGSPHTKAFKLVPFNAHLFGWPNTMKNMILRVNLLIEVKHLPITQKVNIC